MKTRSEQPAKDASRFRTVGRGTGDLVHKYNNVVSVVRCNLDMLPECLPIDVHVRRRYHAGLNASRCGSEPNHSMLAVAHSQPLESGSCNANALLADSLPLAPMMNSPRVGTP